MELWQLAGRWLVQVGSLPADSPVLLPNARVYDLALALQDGTVLCNAANKLAPNCIPAVHQKPEKQVRNTHSFLFLCASFCFFVCLSAHLRRK